MANWEHICNSYHRQGLISLEYKEHFKVNKKMTNSPLGVWGRGWAGEIHKNELQVATEPVEDACSSQELCVKVHEVPVFTCHVGQDPQV